MKARMFAPSSLLWACLAMSISSAAAQQMPAPDNSRTNKNPAGATADQQSNSETDRQLAQSVRKAIVEDKSLSTYAHNVKVISRNGQITLKGPVRSENEKQAIEAKAAEVAGKDNVVSELTVAPNSQ